jgi:hypothetical protein
MRVITCAANVASTPIIPSPPPAYDHRKQLLYRSVALIQQKYPQLQDLAESGKAKISNSGVESVRLIISTLIALNN